MAMTIVMLAAGMGSRFGGPKQLEPVGANGETILDYAIYDALRAGFEKAVLVVRRDMQPAFEETIAARWRKRLPIVFVHQELDALPVGFTVPPGRTRPWGTGHAVLTAAPAVDDRFAVVNADDFYGAEAFQTVGDFLKKSEPGPVPTYVNVGFALHDTMTEAGVVNRAVLHADDQGWLDAIEEVVGIEKHGDQGRARTASGSIRTIPGETIVSMNLWGFTPDLFDRLREGFRTFLTEHADSEKKEFFLPDYLQGMIDRGEARVRILTGAGRWCGITYPEDKPRVAGVLAELIERGEYPADLTR